MRFETIYHQIPVMDWARAVGWIIIGGIVLLFLVALVKSPRTDEPQEKVTRDDFFIAGGLVAVVFSLTHIDYAFSSALFNEFRPFTINYYTTDLSPLNQKVAQTYGGEVVDKRRGSYFVKFEDGIRECNLELVGYPDKEDQRGFLLCNGVEPQKKAG